MFYIITENKDLTIETIEKECTEYAFLQGRLSTFQKIPRMKSFRMFWEYGNFYAAVISELKQGLKPVIFSYEPKNKKLKRRRLLKKYFNVDNPNNAKVGA